MFLKRTLHHKLIALPLILQLAYAVDATAFQLDVSLSPDRTNPVPLDGATVTGNIYVFTTPESGASSVRFWLDNPGMTGSPRHSESNAPFDFVGGTVSTATAFQTEQVADGGHSITAAIVRSDGMTEVVTATFVVSNEPAPPTEGPPDQVHLAWVEDPATTLTIVWRTRNVTTPSSADYRPAGATSWQSEIGAPRPSGTSGILHEVTLRRLTPDSGYEYRVPGDGGVWSPAFTTHTAPPAGPADFSVIYVADTGLVGRLDGLATGTQQVVDEIVALQPTLVLPGGDYVYFDTDKRYGSLQNTIDAWFNQMQPIAARSPLMPTYGNHEALLGEGFAPWAARFPTPEGFDSRRNYSFDVGDVHFVSIFAVSNSEGLSSGTLQWIVQDILAAQAAGQRWIIPYFHVSPFADGTNHHSNTQLRAQLGPLFESLDIHLVLASHDQAYERTYPLTDVPATNTSTSSSRTCYTTSDGVTWVTVSPGGKMSNLNGGFSQFATVPPPSWTAVRTNSHHHFSRLVVSAAGSIRLDTYGVTGEGSPPVMVDSFQYTTGTCPPELMFDSSAATIGVAAGETTVAQVDLSTTLGTASYTVSESAPWLTVSPQTGITPVALTLQADASGLAAGTTHTTTVTASAPGYAPATMEVTLTVGGGDGAYTLVWSRQATRTGAEGLDGAQTDGNLYAFVTPDTGATQVRFYLDNPGMNGAPRNRENTAPYDFAGGTVAAAVPFDTRQLADGLHTITAAIDRTTGGTEVVHATFTVGNNAPALLFSSDAVAVNAQAGDTATAVVNLSATAGTASYTVSDTAPWLTVNPEAGATSATLTLLADTTGLAAGTTHTATVTATAPGYTQDTLQVTLTVGGGGGTHTLVWSRQANRTAAEALDGAQVEGNMYAFVTPGTGVTRVRFYLDDPGTNGAPRFTEKTAPHDFAGGSVATANPFNTGQLSDGSHTITAVIDRTSGGTVVVHATFTVAND
ncbi:MAG: metallophosphoesterase family protein [Woeseia sp.]